MGTTALCYQVNKDSFNLRVGVLGSFLPNGQHFCTICYPVIKDNFNLRGINFRIVSTQRPGLVMNGTVYKRLAVAKTWHQSLRQDAGWNQRYWKYYTLIYIISGSNSEIFFHNFKRHLKVSKALIWLFLSSFAFFYHKNVQTFSCNGFKIGIYSLHRFNHFQRVRSRRRYTHQPGPSRGWTGSGRGHRPLRLLDRY